ncbi:MBL fold metallo-hydrolase RNA specificity domain-containing protein [Pyxidicoccus trucidator]|uniref:MBL fold metallo-hydrolase RNA specificity domain-containing protein n=1 Tax=Pyxidicoccus trucidator TaxID=2709662 RepID=UPI001F08857C|nr:MBL fold metallo-hydrolase RNA specificity domain-containing protein [Pyxidicoccus trucidator]
MSGFSAHADWTEIESPPRQTLLVHGEPEALEGLSQRVRAKGWKSYVPAYLEKVELERTA